MSTFVRYLKDFVFLLFPKVCETCGKPLATTEHVICLDCLYELPRTNYSSIADNPIDLLFAGRMKVEHATALFQFHKGSRYQKLLHKLKYKHKPEIGVFLGTQLGFEMKKSDFFNDVDLLIPVPLHKSRLKQRGYNQSEMICRGISEATGIPVMVDNLVRNVATTTQTKKSKEERWQNVAGKFGINDVDSLVGKHVMLVDDVITTGSTTEACGTTLLQVSGLRLSIGVLAKA